MKSNFTLLFLFIIIRLTAQTPQHQWVKSAGGDDDDRSQCVATDLFGNVIVAGQFESPSIAFGGITLYNSDNVTNTQDLFLVKYDPFGNVIWAKSAGDWYVSEFMVGVTTDPSGNIFITGSYNGDSLQFDSQMIYREGGDDTFLAKYDPSGNVLWVKNIHSPATSSTEIALPKGIATDVNGNILITGMYSGTTIDFGPATAVGIGSYDTFIAKYNAAGTFLWGKAEGGNGEDVSTSVSVDSAGNVFITGTFNETMTVGSTTLTSSTAGSTNDIFMVKYDPNGNTLWAKRAGNMGEDWVTGCTDHNGNLIIAGNYDDPTITFGSTTLTNATSDDEFFLVKFDPLGNVIWARTAAGGYHYAKSVASALNGNIIATGRFPSIVSSAITFGSLILNNGGSDEIFLVEYSSSGTALWAKASEALLTDVLGTSVATNQNGDVFTIGNYYQAELIFDTDTITNAFSGGGFDDSFIWKLHTDSISSCFAGYSTVYDSTSNTFTLTVDTATTAMATGYFWDFGDGSTSTLTSPSHTYAIDSIYNVCMKIYTASYDSCTYCHDIGIDGLGNIIRTGGFYLNVNPGTTTGIVANTEKQTESVIYPNPNKGNFIIEASSALLKTEVVTILGQSVYSTEYSGSGLYKSEINLPELSNGIYYVKLYFEKECITKKISITK